MTLHDEYLTYITSRAWRMKAGAMKRRYPECEACEQSYDLEVHHLHYRTLRHENPRDLVVICGDCHEATHSRTGPADLDLIASEHPGTWEEIGLDLDSVVPRSTAPRLPPAPRIYHQRITAPRLPRDY